MHKEGGSYEIRNGERIKIDEARREELMRGEIAPDPEPVDVFETEDEDE